MRLGVPDLTAIHHNFKVVAKKTAVQEELDRLGFRIAGQSFRNRREIVEELADAGHESLFERAGDHLPVNRVLGGTPIRDFRRIQIVAEKPADDGVVSLSVHELVHLLSGFQAVTAIENHPGLAVHGVRVNKHAIHIENQSQPGSQQ
jgi:hypothetical protein